jgi:alpha-tubulin suppressor-like RCC1 family protein
MRNRDSGHRDHRRAHRVELDQLVGLCERTNVAIYPGTSLWKRTESLLWWSNNSGRLGDGTETDALVPITVSGLTNIVDISTGGTHTCAVLTNGTVKCWGWNFRGQLGDGTTTKRLTPVTVTGISRSSCAQRLRTDSTSGKPSGRSS